MVSTETNSNPLRTVPVLHIHGMNDYFVSYNGSQYWKVILFKVIDGGHTWPGAGIPDYENAGKANNDFSANAEILDFL